MKLKMLKNNKGFSLVELMASAMILVLVGASTLSVVISTMILDRNSRVRSELYAHGAHVIEKIQQGDTARSGLIKARSSTVSIAVGGDQITFDVDKNDPYTTSTADDTEVSIYFDNGDGDDNTIDDNVIMYDPDTSVNNDEFEIAENVASLLFTDTSGVITVDVTLTSNLHGQDMSVDLSRDIYMRN